MSQTLLIIAPVLVLIVLMLYIPRWRRSGTSTWRKCPICLRWHRRNQIQYITPTYITNPDWMRCPACETSRKKPRIP